MGSGREKIVDGRWGIGRILELCLVQAVINSELMYPACGVLLKELDNWDDIRC